MWRGGRKAGLDMMRRLRPGDGTSSARSERSADRSRRYASISPASAGSDKPGFEAASLERVKLAVKIGIEKKLVVLGETHDASPQTASSSLRRARASRDITVPIGSSAISAMAR